jgi:hypothetical protein
MVVPCCLLCLLGIGLGVWVDDSSFCSVDPYSVNHLDFCFFVQVLAMRQVVQIQKMYNYLAANLFLNLKIQITYQRSISVANAGSHFAYWATMMTKKATEHVRAWLAASKRQKKENAETS